MFQSPLKTNQWMGSALPTVALLLCTTLTMPVDAGEWKMRQQSASYMGTKWHIALYSRDAEAANAGFDAAWRMIGDIDRDLTNYSADSELNRLCRTAPHAVPVKVGEHLWNVLEHADHLSRRTDGAFDVTIGPVSKLWRRARSKKQLPDAKQLAQARSAVGFQYIELDAHAKTVRLTKPNMQIDLGGIAKGYAADKAIETLHSLGITSALVNGGGDLAVSDAPPDQDAWRVEIAGLNPSEDATSLDIVNSAVATSGDAWQFLEIDGKRYSHIINPKTGLGTTQRVSATVLAPNCMTADALASALCVLDVTQGMRLIEETNSVEARLIFAADEAIPETRYSGGFPKTPPK